MCVVVVVGGAAARARPPTTSHTLGTVQQEASDHPKENTTYPHPSPPTPAHLRVCADNLQPVAEGQPVVLRASGRGGWVGRNAPGGTLDNLLPWLLPPATLSDTGAPPP